jgi:hypothetical protein
LLYPGYTKKKGELRRHSRHDCPKPPGLQLQVDSYRKVKAFGITKAPGAVMPLSDGIQKPGFSYQPENVRILFCFFLLSFKEKRSSPADISAKRADIRPS